MLIICESSGLKFHIPGKKNIINKIYFKIYIKFVLNGVLGHNISEHNRSSEYIGVRVSNCDPIQKQKHFSIR